MNMTNDELLIGAAKDVEHAHELIQRVRPVTADKVLEVRHAVDRSGCRLLELESRLRKAEADLLAMEGRMNP